MRDEALAFKVVKDGQLLDYRVGQEVDLDTVRQFFEQRYAVASLEHLGRHVVGHLKADDDDLFLKVSTTPGISVLTKIEHDFNEAFHRLVGEHPKFTVPKNKEDGFFDPQRYYLITEMFNGNVICNFGVPAETAETMQDRISDIIELAELVQNLEGLQITARDAVDACSYQEWFVNKAKGWYNAISPAICEEHAVADLLPIVEAGAVNLQRRARHGDFTPWHIFSLDKGRLGLIDAEHAMSDGVEYYDISYFMQRVHSELGAYNLAIGIYNKLLDRGYDPAKLKTVLAARAIGGYLDATFGKSPDYTHKDNFRDWVIHL